MRSGNEAESELSGASFCLKDVDIGARGVFFSK